MKTENYTAFTALEECIFIWIIPRALFFCSRSEIWKMSKRHEKRDFCYEKGRKILLERVYFLLKLPDTYLQ